MTEIRWKSALHKDLEVREKNGVAYLSYPALEKTGMVRHGFSTRLGGVSRGIFSTMNLGFGRGDCKEDVLENYRRVAAAVGFDYQSIVTSDQTHTTNVRKITEKDRGNGITREREFHEVDGMITNVPGLVLTTYYADCVPLYFVDPVHRAIGLSHSGWRGTVGKIGRVTVEMMKKEYGTEPKDLLAAIGPSICRDCYEVSEDVIEKFKEAFDEKLWDRLFYSKGGGKYQLDLWEANRQILMEAQIPCQQILLPDLCTCCNPQFLFSHRASKGQRGNLAAFLELL